MAKEYRVMMTIKGTVVDSSCIFAGPLEKAQACRARLKARDHHRDVGYVVLPCIQ